MSEAHLDEINARSLENCGKVEGSVSHPKCTATSQLQVWQTQALPCLVPLFFKRSEDSGNSLKIYKI